MVKEDSYSNARQMLRIFYKAVIEMEVQNFRSRDIDQTVIFFFFFWKLKKKKTSAANDFADPQIETNRYNATDCFQKSQ